MNVALTTNRHLIALAELEARVRRNNVPTEPMSVPDDDGGRAFAVDARRRGVECETVDGAIRVVLPEAWLEAARIVAEEEERAIKPLKDDLEALRYAEVLYCEKYGITDRRRANRILVQLSVVGVYVDDGRDGIFFRKL